MRKKFKTEAEHILDAMYRLVNTRPKFHGLLSIPKIQFDKYIFEKRNRDEFHHLESLVIWGVFETIEVDAE